MSGANKRPIYCQSELNDFSPVEFKYSGAAGVSKDLLMFSRNSVNGGENLGMLWEAGSGATKYYSNRFAASYDSSLRGDFLFFTNHTGNATTSALTEKARIRYDGSFIHEGYHQLTTSFATSGSGVPNGAIFKGSDGALYYKGGSGTVTMLAPN
jgi:hypothetical protein